MKKFLLSSLVLFSVVLGCQLEAKHHRHHCHNRHCHKPRVNLNIGTGIVTPAVIAPAPVYVVQPAPVQIVQPAPVVQRVVVQQAPVVQQVVVHQPAPVQQVVVQTAPVVQYYQPAPNYVEYYQPVSRPCPWSALNLGFSFRL